MIERSSKVGDPQSYCSKQANYKLLSLLAWLLFRKKKHTVIVPSSLVRTAYIIKIRTCSEANKFNNFIHFGCFTSHSALPEYIPILGWVFCNALLTWLAQDENQPYTFHSKTFLCLSPLKLNLIQKKEAATLHPSNQSLY